MEVVIYEGGRIPGGAEEGAAAGEVIGGRDQNRWWQYNAHMWHCTATVKKTKRVRQHAFSQWRSRGTFDSDPPPLYILCSVITSYIIIIRR